MIVWNAVRDQPGIGVRDQWNAHAGDACNAGGQHLQVGHQRYLVGAWPADWST